MIEVATVEATALDRFRELHNRYVDRDESIATVRKWHEDHPRLLVGAFDGDELVGHALGLAPDGDGGAVELAGLSVVESHRRRGIGSRLVAAIEHPATDILGHPTGRLLGRRSGLDVDAEAIAAAAADAGVAMEVNANPSRLDLSGRYVRAAVDARATVAIDTDAHGPPEFDNVTYGVYTARRGWATADDVLNAGSAADVRAFLG